MASSRELDRQYRHRFRCEIDGKRATKGPQKWHGRHWSAQVDELSVTFCAIPHHLRRTLRASRYVTSGLARSLGRTARTRCSKPLARPNCRVVADRAGARDGLGLGEALERATSTRRSAQLFDRATSRASKGVPPRLRLPAQHNHRVTRSA